MIKTEICPICNSPDLKLLKRHIFNFPGDDVKNHLKEISYTRRWILFKKIITDRNTEIFESTLCGSCGFIFTNPRFTEDEIKIKYDTINQLGSVKFRIQKFPSINVTKRANRIYRLITSLYNSASIIKPKILDYGGASGENLVPFIDDFNCGILDYERWELPEGIDYLGRDLTDLTETDRFDIILLIHTLEHIIHPKEFLNELCNYLNDDGIIYVEVPLGCFFKEWKYLVEPLTHVNFFSEQSLFNCCRVSSLNVINLRTSFQQVTTNKKWCLNVVATKLQSKENVKSNDVLPVEKQMSKIKYYIPYFFNFKVITRGLKMLKGAT